MKPHFIAAIMALLLGLCSGQAAHADSFPAGSTDYAAYTVNPGQMRVIDQYGTCRVVTNNSPTGRAVYVPMKTAAEWNGPNGFANKPPAGVTLGLCYKCTLTYPQTQTFSGETCSNGPTSITLYEWVDYWGWANIGTYPYAYPYTALCGYYLCQVNYGTICTPWSYTTTYYSPTFAAPGWYDNLNVTLSGGGGGGAGTFYQYSYMSSDWLGIDSQCIWLWWAGTPGNNGNASTFGTAQVPMAAGGGCGGANGGACGAGGSSGPGGTAPPGMTNTPGVTPLLTNDYGASGAAGGAGVWGQAYTGGGDYGGGYDITEIGAAGGNGEVVQHVYNTDDNDLVDGAAGPSPAFSSGTPVSIGLGAGGGSDGFAGGSCYGYGDYNAPGNAGSSGSGYLTYSTSAPDTGNLGANCVQMTQ